MFSFELTDKYFTNQETEVFDEYLTIHGLDRSIWEVFACLFKAGMKYTTPLLLKAYDDTGLCGSTIVIKCRRYGQALFNSRFLARIVNFFGIPFHLWIKFGTCMDMMSNPGFVKDPTRKEEVIGAMISYMKRKKLLTIINDYSHHQGVYGTASILPALPHALIDCSSITDLQDYMKSFKNLKRKLNVFKIKGGIYGLTQNQLNNEEVAALKKCFLSTSEKSVFYLPYQELYLNAALTTSSTPIDQVYYFIATLNGEFMGYQAAIRTGNHLNALHGAFDRHLKSTYHAYDILFVKMTEFAIEHGLKLIDFGAVLNYTKQKMVNKTIDLSYYIFSKYRIIQQLLHVLLKLTKIQGEAQLKFR